MRHVPVLLGETIDSLKLKPGNIVVDCTLGDGGHSEEIIKKIQPNGVLVGIDADIESLERAKDFLTDYKIEKIFINDNFSNLDEILKNNNLEKVDGILMDFGWSTPQFADRNRGFSFQTDEELDMRYDSQNQELTAKDIINKYSEDDLAEIFRKYGDEKNSKKIAKVIVEKRKAKEISKTSELVEIILTINKKGKEKIHPATRVFQALRIEINNELGVIKEVLPKAVDALNSNGRLAVITFHSLEDAIVKHYFKSQSHKTINIINKKPITCSQEELKNNPRARSAKLRVIEKI